MSEKRNENEVVINSFTFYKNYYDLIKNLPQEEYEEMAVLILDYMFSNTENELKRGNIALNNAIFASIKMGLDTSKINAFNSKKRIKDENSNEKKTKQKRNKNEMNNEKKTKKVTNNISYFLFLISNFKYIQDRGLLRGKIEDWLEYKSERKEEYTEKGLKSLLTQIENKCKNFGEEKIIELIDDCMASNYKGIIFEKLEKQNKNSETKKKNNQMEILKGVYDGTIKIN